MANSKNPILLLVPCHRVIGAKGSLTGYAGGLEMKQYLLNLERGIYYAAQNERVNRDLDDAFQRFFNHSLQNGFPRFKSKKNTNQSYTSKFVNNNIRIVNEHHIIN